MSEREREREKEKFSSAGRQAGWEERRTFSLYLEKICGTFLDLIASFCFAYASVFFLPFSSLLLLSRYGDKSCKNLHNVGLFHKLKTAPRLLLALMMGNLNHTWSLM